VNPTHLHSIVLVWRVWMKKDSAEFVAIHGSFITQRAEKARPVVSSAHPACRETCLPSPLVVAANAASLWLIDPCPVVFHAAPRRHNQARTLQCHTHTYTHTQTHTHARARMHLHTHTHMHKYHAHTHMCTHARTRTRTHATCAVPHMLRACTLQTQHLLQ
jgi:hypothetical protein